MSEKLSSADLHLLLDEPIYVLDKSINPEAAKEIDESTQPETILQYKGGFDKKVLVLIQDVSKEQIKSEEEEFLLKIMGAVKLDLTDIAILNIEEVTNWQDLMDPDMVIGFGLESSPIAHYELHNLNECTHFYADNLNEIAENVGLKRQLWEGLKKMFP